MAFLIAVLAIHFGVKAIVDKSKRKNKTADTRETKGIKHPAEFMLRQND